MVDPDLEMPGKMARACAEPIKMASINVIFTRSPPANRVLHKIQPVAIKKPHTAIGLAKASLSVSLNKIPMTPAGMESDYQQVDGVPGRTIAAQTSDE